MKLETSVETQKSMQASEALDSPVFLFFEGGFRLKKLLMILVFFCTAGLAQDESLPPVDLLALEDLSPQGEGGALNGRPLLLAFVADYCHYCEIVEEEFLKPMLRNRAYDSKVVIRTVDLGSNASIVGFDGRALSIRALAERYQVKVTPTVAFLNSAGTALAPTLVGVSNIEFYGGFLDDAIDAALSRVTAAADEANRP